MGVSGNSNAKAAAQPKRTNPKGSRDKTLSPHGHTARFLYLMLKQLNHKQVDWQKVADGTGLASGRSAQARFGRFKKQVESQILGDAIEIKREQEEEARVSVPKPTDNIEDDTFGLKRAFEEDSDSEAWLRDYSASDAESKKRIKLENDDSHAGMWQRASSVISIDDDNNVGNPTSPTPFIKREPTTTSNKEEPGLNDLPNLRTSPWSSATKSKHLWDNSRNALESSYRQPSLVSPWRSQNNTFGNPWMTSEAPATQSCTLTFGVTGANSSGQVRSNTALDPVCLD